MKGIRVFIPLSALALALIMSTSCKEDRILYENPSYRMYADRIVQGDYTSIAESPYKIVSNLDGEKYVWEKKNDLGAFPKLSSPNPIEEAVYNIGLDECINAVEPDGTLRTGLEWSGVWTRDVSYSIIHSMAFMQTEAAKTSLMCKVNAKGEIIQDTGTGGAWPCSTDREIWVGAAYEIYKVTGDMEWLKKVYPIAKKSLDVDIRTMFESRTNLFRGESSFIDWRKQSYPIWMQPADIYDSKCLGTNMVFYIALSSAAQMGRILGDDATAEAYESQAELVKKGINDNLWMEDKGYYAQYISGRSQDVLYTKSETLGEALAILWGVAKDERAAKLSENMPVVDFGAPVFYPWIPDIPPYHNQAVWPYVQTYWLRACAKAGNEPGILHGVAAVWRAAMMYATNKENYVADTGDWKGTEINSSNMLWSLSGNLSIFFKLLIGMNFRNDSLAFAPVVPTSLKADRTIRDFHYRNAVLDITVSGCGDSVKSFKLDGKPQEKAVVQGDIEGHHTIEIELTGHFKQNLSINYSKPLWTPAMPEVVQEKDALAWDKIEGADHYDILVAGRKAISVQDTKVGIHKDWTGDVQVIAVAADGTPSFPSEPINFSQKVYQDFPEATLRKKDGKEFKVVVTIPSAGEWALSWMYANGAGPVETDNNCGIRMLYIDSRKASINIFPQRGKDDWDNWGWTIPEVYELSKGSHTLTLKFEPDCDNMDPDINDFKIKRLCLIKN